MALVEQPNQSDTVQHDRTRRAPLSHTIRWVRIDSDTFVRDMDSTRTNPVEKLVHCGWSPLLSWLLYNLNRYGHLRLSKTSDCWMDRECNKIVGYNLCQLTCWWIALAVCSLFTANDP